MKNSEQVFEVGDLVSALVKRSGASTGVIVSWSAASKVLRSRLVLVRWHDGYINSTPKRYLKIEAKAKR